MSNLQRNYTLASFTRLEIPIGDFNTYSFKKKSKYQKQEESYMDGSPVSPCRKPKKKRK